MRKDILLNSFPKEKHSPNHTTDSPKGKIFPKSYNRAPKPIKLYKIVKIVSFLRILPYKPTNNLQTFSLLRLFFVRFGIIFRYKNDFFFANFETIFRKIDFSSLELGFSFARIKIFFQYLETLFAVHNICRSFKIFFAQIRFFLR